MLLREAEAVDKSVLRGISEVGFGISGCWKMEAGCWKLDAGSGKWEVGSGKLEDGSWMRDAGSGKREVEVGSWKWDTGNSKKKMIEEVTLENEIGISKNYEDLIMQEYNFEE